MGMVTRNKDGEEINPGDTVKDFRGNEWVFIRGVVARLGHRSGKVMVATDRNNRKRQTFYEEVFDLTVAYD